MFEAARRQRQFVACQPENRLVARTLEAALEQALTGVDQRRRALEDLQRRRPAPLSDDEGRSLRRLAGNLGASWNAVTTVDQDRNQRLRALLEDVVLDVDRDHNAGVVELLRHGGARTALVVRLNHSGLKRTSTPVDLIGLIRRLAQHSSDREIAVVLSKQGRRTPTGLPFTATRVAGIRERAGISAASPSTAAGGGSLATRPPANSGYARRPSAAGCQKVCCLPSGPRHMHRGGSPLPSKSRARFVPSVPAGYRKLDEAARQLGVARQTMLNQVRSGHRHAVHVVEGKRRELRIQVRSEEQGQLAHEAREERAAKPRTVPSQ